MKLIYGFLYFEHVSPFYISILGFIVLLLLFILLLSMFPVVIVEYISGCCRLTVKYGSDYNHLNLYGL